VVASYTRALYLLSGAAAVCLAGNAAAAAASNDAASSTSATVASADTKTSPTIGEVVVTARRVRENIQKVPVAVTAFSGAQLEQLAIRTPSDLQFAVPSLTATGTFGHTFGSYAIRGLTAGVVTYFSEAPGGPTTVGMPFFDLASTQVLNGPQGTLFGRSGAAGAILITPEHPNLSKFGGFMDLTFGDYGREQLTGVINIPLVSDKLALRLAVHREHIDGYTSLIGNPITGTPGSSEKLDESNSNSIRVGLEWKPGRFDNYLVYSRIDINETPGAQVLSGVNSLTGLLALPSAFYPFVFGGICATAVTDGFSPNSATCVAQRSATLAQIKASLTAEGARIAAGGNAVRSTFADPLLPPNEKVLHSDVVDVAQYDFGELGGLTTLIAKNIFSYQRDTDVQAWSVDGLGGLLEDGIATSSPVDTWSVSAQLVGNGAVGAEGPPTQTYTEEFQLHGDAGHGLLDWTGGAFYQFIRYPTNLAGVPNVFHVFDGLFTPNLGYNVAFGYQDGGYTDEEAAYGQATINLAKWGVHGLSLTGGIRDTKDYTNQPSFTPVTNFPSGVLTPGALVVAKSASSGYNYTFAVDEQVTDKLLIYATTRKAYVPGGVNTVLGINGGNNNLPNYSPTYQPELVKDYEIGVKTDFCNCSPPAAD